MAWAIRVMEPAATDVAAAEFVAWLLTPEVQEWFVENTFELMPRQALHARTLGFHHPATGEWLELESPPPEDFTAALAALRELAR